MDDDLTFIPHDAPTTIYDPVGERCTMLAAHGAFCRVRYCNGMEDRFRIEDMEHPGGVKGLRQCVTFVSMREVFEAMAEAEKDED
jgi:hypothetical protein